MLLLSSSVNAENPTITRPTDIWFEYTEPTLFIAQTYQSEGYPSDPQLWLYTEADELIVSNDDYNGLQSYISVELQPGRYRLRAGTCCWQPDVWRDGITWNVQYELGYGQGAVTTTLPPLPSTTLPPTTTTEPPQTTTTTSSTTTTTEVPTTTTTSTSTTTTSAPTIPPVPETTQPPLTLPPTTTSTTTTTVPPTTTTMQPSTTTTSASTSTIPSTTTTTTTTTTLPVVDIPAVVSSEQATELATNPEVLAEATAEEATEIFEALIVGDLSEEQLIALVAAVQDAPLAVRESFEAEVNVFGGGVDTYVPIGSTVPVGTRRTLIALSVISTLPAVVKRKW